MVAGHFPGMGSSYDKHRDRVESARRKDGKFGSYEADESGATLPIATIGVTSYRGEDRGVRGAAVDDPYYDSEEYQDLREHIELFADEHGVEVLSEETVPGIWKADTEPSSALTVRGSREAIRGFAGDIAERYNQDSVMTAVFDDAGQETLQRFSLENAGPLEEVFSDMEDAGRPAGRINGEYLEIATLPVEDREIGLPADIYGEPEIANAHVELVGKSGRVERAPFPGYGDDEAGAGGSYGSRPDLMEQGVNRSHGTDLALSEDEPGVITVTAGSQGDTSAAIKEVEHEAAKYGKRVVRPDQPV